MAAKEIETPKIDLYVSPSQLEQFHCRLAWWWGTRKRLQPIRLQIHLELGSGIHLALERYYRENKNPVKVFTRWADQRIDEMDTLWDEDVTAMIKARTLGIEMLKGYLKTYRNVETLEPVLVEGEMVRNLPHPNTGAPTNIAMVCRVDTVVRDVALRKLFVLEHKTFTRFDSSQLQRDHQFAAELWVAQQYFEKPVAGVIYNGLRKQVSGPRVKLNLFERQYIYINQHQVKVFLTRAFWTGVQLMAAYRRQLEIYPEPSLFRCQQCPFKEPCTAYMRGDDVQYILETRYTKKPKFERQEGRNEGSQSRN